MHVPLFGHFHKQQLPASLRSDQLSGIKPNSVSGYVPKQVSDITEIRNQSSREFEPWYKQGAKGSLNSNRMSGPHCLACPPITLLATVRSVIWISRGNLCQFATTHVSS